MDLDAFLLTRVIEDSSDPSRCTAERIRIHEASVRRLVDEYRERQSAYLAIAETDRPGIEKLERHAHWVGFTDAVRILSLPYRGHPDYQAEWDPDWRPTPPPGRA